MRDLLKVFDSTQMEVIPYCIGQKINSFINLYGKSISQQKKYGKF